MVERIVGLADELCDGRLACLGGGGYHIVEVVPLAWTWVMARLLDAELPDEIPAQWRDYVCNLLGDGAPRSLGAMDRFQLPVDDAAAALAATQASIAEVRSVLFPLHGLEP